MIAAKPHLIGPASTVSSDVTVTRRIQRRLARRVARLQVICGPPGTRRQPNSACERIAFVLSYAPTLFDRD